MKHRHKHQKVIKPYLSPSEILTEMDAEKDSALQPSNYDGLYVKILRCFARFPFWRYGYAQIINILLRIKGNQHDVMPRKDAKSCVRIAADIYNTGCGLLIMAMAYCAFLLSKTDYDNSCLLFWFTVLAIFPVKRMSETISVFTQLHTSQGYDTDAPARAIMNVFWHYLEYAFAFSLFYIIIAKIADDQFSAPCGNPFLQSYTNSLYFSFVTITTLGYGDYSPDSWFGKASVCLEVFLGYMLLVWVLGRAIARSVDSD